MLAAYFDDSGTHAGAPVVALGGLLGTERQWIAFEKAWAALLANPIPGKPPLKQFHLTACRSGNGEFRAYNQIERDFVTTEFRKIILDIDLVTIAAAVNKKAWDELVVGPVADELGKPEELCFVKCVDSVINTIRFRKPGEKIVFAFDQGTRSRLGMWARLYLSQKFRYPEIARFGFGAVADVLPLQGADMIALETYQFAQAWLKDRDNPDYNPHFKDFIFRDLSAGLVFDRDQIEEMIERVKYSLAKAQPKK